MHARAMNGQDEHQARARRLLACLGVPSRFRLMCSLTGCERCVTELAAEIGLSQSCTTRHLQALQREGLVHGVRRGKRVVFHALLEDAHAGGLLAWVLASPGAAAGLISGAGIHRDHAAHTRAARASRPRRAKRGPEGAGQEARPGASTVAPAAGREPAGDHPAEVGSGAEPEAARSPVPLRRGDLEDYLL